MLPDQWTDRKERQALLKWMPRPETNFRQWMVELPNLLLPTVMNFMIMRYYLSTRGTSCEVCLPMSTASALVMSYTPLRMEDAFLLLFLMLFMPHTLLNLLPMGSPASSAKAVPKMYVLPSTVRRGPRWPYLLELAFPSSVPLSGGSMAWWWSTLF
jgi:hypothetical protein